MTAHEVRKLPPGAHVMANGTEYEVVNWFGKKLLHEPGTANYKAIREEYRYSLPEGANDAERPAET